MDSIAILFNKEGLLFSRVAQNQYRLTFNIQNNNIINQEIIACRGNFLLNVFLKKSSRKLKPD